MFDLAFRNPPASLRPARALLTPTWLAALALLIANDHVLKGAGLLPGVVTGKLSDFAGMLVAPTLFAVVIGARSKQALIACHVAVGAVFAGIQISPGFASLWSAFMGLFGHPWTITCDVTDLIALPFLLLSWALLVPEMDAELPALAPAQRSAVAVSSVVGLWSTVATSDGSWADVGDGWYEDVNGHAFVNNANDFDVSLHIRALRDDLAIDCTQISADPGRLLDESAFGEAEHWLLPARTNVALNLEGNSSCGAVWIAGEGVPATIVFVDDTWSLPLQWFPGQSLDPQTLGSAGMAIEFPATGGSRWIGGELMRFTPKDHAPEQPEACEPDAAEMRFAWPASLPSRAVALLSVDAGVDGCFDLHVQELMLTEQGDGYEPAPTGEPYDVYLCVPAAAMPFSADDIVQFVEQRGGSGEAELTVVLLDGATLTTAVDENGSAIRQARYLRGGHDLQLIGPAIGRELVAVDNVSCPWMIEQEGCASVERTVELSVVGGQEFLQPGVAVAFGDPTQDRVHTTVLGYARQLAVVDHACAEGSLALRYDIDLAVIDSPL